MADGLFGGAYIGNPNIQRQGERARALAQQRGVNTLPDPKTYAAVQGLFGTAPDEMGFSVLNPQYQSIMQTAQPAFALGTALGLAPSAQALLGPAMAIGRAGQRLTGVAAPVQKEIAPLLGYHRTTTPFEGDFQNLKNQFGVSFAGNRGFYFSPEINDPTAQIFGKHIISANVAVKNPAPIYQVKFGMDTNIQTPRSIVPIDEKWLKENPEAIRQGGLALANSIDDVIAGKTMGMTGNFAAYEEQVKKAAKQNKLFALIDPEKLYDKQVNLLESKGYDGFNYVRPESATASMPSQIVAFRPEQIKRLSSGNEAQLLQDPANVQYKDPFADTIR